MVKIRLTRLGDHKAPVYRIVVADANSPRDGRFIEVLGTYDPHLENGLKLDADKAKEWIKTARNLPTLCAPFLLTPALLRAKSALKKPKLKRKRRLNNYG